MSEPQMVEARMRNSTCPCPGSGTGNSRSSTVESPGSTAAVIVRLLIGRARARARRARRARRPQRLGRLLGGDVALQLGQQLVTDHELAAVGGQQRRVNVGMKLPP